MTKIEMKGLAIAIGALLATYVFLLGIFAMFGWGTAIVEFIGNLYIGYAPTLLGSIIGALYAFVDGAIAGIIIAFVYNKISKK
jgi:hypothetical protein